MDFVVLIEVLADAFWPVHLAWSQKCDWNTLENKLKSHQITTAAALVITQLCSPPYIKGVCVCVCRGGACLNASGTFNVNLFPS